MNGTVRIVAGQFRGRRLASAHGRAHMGVAGIKHYRKVRMIDFLDQPHNLTWLVEHKARLEFPGHHDAPPLGKFGVVTKRLDRSLPGILVTHAGWVGGLGQSIDPDHRDFEIQA